MKTTTKDLLNAFFNAPDRQEKFIEKQWTFSWQQWEFGW